MENPGRGSRPVTRKVVQEVLERVADCVASQTPFRRILVTAYDDDLVPSREAPTAAVAAFASRGVSAHQLQSLQRFVQQGGRVSGKVYSPDARVGSSYYFADGALPPPTSLRLPSVRSFVPGAAWSAEDVLLSPFWNGDGVIGHISVDDPSDGARPSGNTLERLEKLAAAFAVSLRDARDLENLSEDHKVFRLLTESALTGVLVIEENVVRYANARACELLGYDGAAIGSLNPWWQVIHPDDRPAVWHPDGKLPETHSAVRAIRRDGRPIWLTVRTYPMDRLDGSSAFVLHFFDITEHIEMETQLKEKALRDPLTGLLNRSYFEDAIRTEVERSRRYKRPLTLMMADLSRFKLVNDRLGHQEGDRILVGIASVLRAQLRDSDWVVRFGGDEFLFVLPETGTDVESLEARLHKAVGDWCESHADGLPLGIDFGWATWTADRPRETAALVREADEMLYKRKADR